MFTIEYNQAATICRITLLANGNQRIVTNYPAAIEEGKAYLLTTFMCAYLRHRYQAYRHVGITKQANTILRAIAQIKPLCNNKPMLDAWIKRNAPWLHSIEPKRHCIWNDQLKSLLGK